MNQSYRPDSKGFTLIELMFVVMIMAILLTIALPSYRQHFTNKAQIQAQQQAQYVVGELAQWRSKRLTYAGFVFSAASDVDSDLINSEINGGSEFAVRYLPSATTAENYQYLIRLSGYDGKFSLTDAKTNGNGWRMLVIPNPEHQMMQDAETFYLDSMGQRCRYGAGSSIPRLDSHSHCGAEGSW